MNPTPIEALVLQGDADADGFTILNLNLAGLNLTKDSVGLGNVNNTSDVNKPVSTAQALSIGLREPAITPGEIDQVWRGDKSWQTLGALAVEGGNTTLQELSAIGLNTTGVASVGARRNDYASSNANVAIGIHGVAAAGTTLGLSNANLGVLNFINTTLAAIYTSNLSPIVFGYNNVPRMRLMTGLNVGGATDPGIGCINASAHISAGGNISATGTILAGGAVGGGTGVITTTLEVGTDLSVGDDLAVTGDITGGGTVNFAALPTSDPAVVGRLWRSGADLKVSI